MNQRANSLWFQPGTFYSKERIPKRLFSTFNLLNLFNLFASLTLLAQNASDLTTSKDLQSLTRAQAAGGVHFRLKGTVLCYDEGWHQLYIHDGRSTAYISPQDSTNAFHTGQTVDVIGTALGGNSLTNVQISIVGEQNVPVPKPLALSQLANDHGQWIETTGRVLSGETSRGRLALLLHDKGQNCLLYVLGSPPTNDFSRLLGSKVQIRGINASKASGGHLESASLFVPGFSDITVLESPTDKQSQIPVVSIGSLLNRELGPWTNNWVHINGLVASYQPGQSLVVKDPTGVIRARIIQLTEIQGHERVDVWGFFNVGQQGAFLDNAYFEVVRPVAQSNLPIVAETPSTGPQPPFLTEILDVAKLSRSDAARRLSVRLRGVLTYADPEWRNGFLQDRSGAIYVDLDPSFKDLHSGQFVEVIGRTSPGGFAPEVLSSSVSVQGATNLPVPIPVDLEDLVNGQLDARWVEMEGVVRRVDAMSRHVSLRLMTPKGRFTAIIPAFDNQPVPTHLIDARVAVQGACSSEMNLRRQLSGITLSVPSLGYIRLINPPPADPFSVATTPIETVATFEPNRLTSRVRVQGVVTLANPGEGFILQDASGGMRVQTRQTNDVAIGDHLDVLGFPAIAEFSPSLEEAIFRKTGTGRMPQPQKTSAEQIVMYGTNAEQVVEIQGRLLQSVPRSANPQLVLQDGQTIFTALLAAQTRRLEVPALQSGSLLRLTGVCSIQGGERHEPETFRLLLRSAEDIYLLEAAPWWTLPHFFMLAGGMMVVILAALAWVALLRRQVRTQTKLIRQKLEDEAALEERFRELFENANDIVYTHDLEGRITSVNQMGEKLLQRSRKEILSRNIVELVSEEQRPAARQWLENVLKDSGPPTAEWDFASASGQRLKVEISTRLIERGGKVVEVEGIARDITDRKRLEREILEISNREQRRIGHDLHDGVCQQLAGIAFMSSTLADELQEKGASESSQAEQISMLINDAINQTRGVARGLFPVRLEENGLISALEELATNASEMFKINCRFVSEDPPTAVDNGIGAHLYYIVLEAVGNAIKHGKAKNITITLEPSSDRFLLGVRDDGIGFAQNDGKLTGMGIRIMQYRARVIGASLTLHSCPSSGTDIACLFVPISREWPHKNELHVNHETNGVSSPQTS
jgi:PAS domain S-box-containing protein